MALRLAGEQASVVLGLDSRGWPRQVQAADTSPGLKVEQDGAAAALQLQPDGDIGRAVSILDATGAELARIGHDGQGGVHLIWTQAGKNLKLIPGDAASRIDCRTALANTAANHNGNVAVDAADELELLGNQKGLIVRTSGGARYRIRVDDSGNVVSEAVS